MSQGLDHSLMMSSWGNDTTVDMVVATMPHMEASWATSADVY